MSKSIGLKFDVLGGSSIDGETGALIKKQLDALAKNLSNEKSCPKVKFQLDTTQTKSIIQDQLKEIVSGLKIGDNAKLQLFGKDVFDSQARTSVAKLKSQVKSIQQSFSTQGFGNAADLKRFKYADQADVDKYVKKVSELKTKFNELSVPDNITDGQMQKVKALIGEYEELTKVTRKTLQTQSIDNKITQGNAQEQTDLIKAMRSARDNSPEIADLLGLKNLNAIKDEKDNPELYEKYADAFKKLNEQVKKCINDQNEWNATLSKDDISETKAAYEDFTSVVNKLNQAEAAAKKDNNSSLGWEKAANSIHTFLMKYEATAKNAPAATKKLKELLEIAQNPNKRKDYSINDIQNQIKTAENGFISAGGAAETMEQKIRRVFKEKFGFGLLGTATIYARQTLKQVYQNVVDINGALTQLSIVTGTSMSQLEGRLDSVAAAAKAANSSMTEILSSTETYARLGYNLDDSQKLAQYTTAFSKIANVSEADATDGITAIMKGYQINASEIERVCNVLTEVGQKYAISASELATGMQIAGATLNTNGTDLEHSAAILAAGNAALQDAHKVANAVKTTQMKLNATSLSAEQKEYLESQGEDVEALISGYSDLRTEIKALSGVDIMKSATEYKSFYDIMEELGAVWDNLNQVQKDTLLEDIAGERNGTVVASILTNINDMTGAYNAAANSAGAYQKAVEKYSDSIQGKMNELNVIFENFSTKLLDAGVVETILGALQTILNIVAAILTFAGGLPVKIGLIVAGILAVKTVWQSLKTSEMFMDIVAWIKILITNIATSVATSKLAGASLIGTIKAVTASLWAQAAAWAATPMGMVTITVAAVAGLAAIISAVTSTTQKVEDLKAAVEKNQEAIDKYKEEADALESLKEKLENAKDNKAELAKIQNELNDAIGKTPGLLNGEAGAYEAANKKLEDKIAYNKKQIKEKQKENVENNSEIFKSRKVRATSLGMDFLAVDMSGDTARYLAQQSEALRSRILGQNHVSKEDWQEFWNDQVETALSEFEITIDNYDGVGGSSVMSAIVEGMVRNGYDDKDILKVVSKITDDSFQSLVDNYYKSLSDPSADSEKALKKVESYIKDIKKDYPYATATLDEYVKTIKETSGAEDKLAESVASVTAEVKKVAKSVLSYSDAYKNFVDGIYTKNADGSETLVTRGVKGLVDAYKTLSDGQKLSIEQSATLLDQYPELQKYVDGNTGRLNVSLDVLKQIFEQTKANLKAKLEETKQTLKSNAELIKSNLALLESQGKAYTYVKTAGQGSLSAITSGRSLTKRNGYSEEYQSLLDAQKQNDDALAAIANQINQYNNWSLPDLAGIDTEAKAVESHKNDFEKWLAEQKHLLATDQITQEQYYRNLNQMYQQFFSDKSKYLDEFNQYSEEVYDGFKSLYEEDVKAQRDAQKKNLNAQKETLQKKMDNLKDYYDEQRELLQDKSDQENYEKEQAEKRKSLDDLTAEIDILSRDTSAKARRLLAEKKSQRDEQQKEYDDFEKEHALQTALDDLSKEEEQRTKEIQNTIDSIDSQISKLDEDVVATRQAVIDFARGKGVYLAYASGTDNSVGGWSITQEKASELIAQNMGNGTFTWMMPSSKVFNDKATAFLYDFANAPQAMLNGLGVRAAAPTAIQSNNYSNNIVTIGDINIEGNADDDTVRKLKESRDDIVYSVLQRLKQLKS